MLSEFLILPTKGNLHQLLIIFLLAVVLLIAQQWHSKRAVGLPLIYAFAYSMLHAIGAFVYSLPKYTPKSDILIQNGSSLQNTHTGFRLACFGFVAFVIGVFLSQYIFSRDPQRKMFHKEPQISTKLPGTLILISIISFFFLTPILRRIPSMGSMATAGTAIAIVGLYLYCWQAWQRGDGKQFGLGLLGTVLFPFVSIVFLGFAGYGATAASMVWMMVVRFFKPRWLSLSVLILLVFGALTFYVNWMAGREKVRSSVWGQRSFEDRMEQVMVLVDNFEMLNTEKQVHLELIDLRLNQNDLVGKAVRYLEAGNVDYARGFTIWVAAVSWVPRILWPGKPKTGGSGGLVAYYTGQRFAEGTSIGAGQPLEFFVNFGWPGVFWSFVILGVLVGWFDRRSAFYLEHGDMWTACRWILPGLGLLQPGGLLAECVGSCSAFAVFAFILHHLLFKKYYDTSAALQLAKSSRLAPIPAHQTRK